VNLDPICPETFFSQERHQLRLRMLDTFALVKPISLTVPLAVRADCRRRRNVCANLGFSHKHQEKVCRGAGDWSDGTR